MKYIARRKGLFRNIGLYSSDGEKLVLPNGVTVKFIEAGPKIFFQLFKNDQKITPVAKSIETNGTAWTMEIDNVGLVDLNVETLKLSPIYYEKKGMVAFLENDKLAFIKNDGKWVNSGLVVDKYRLGRNVEDSYLFKSLIGVKDAMGKCAIFDTESNKVIAPFEFEPSSYDIVAAINNDTMHPERDIIYVVKSETSDYSKFLKNKGTKKFTLISKNGEVVEYFFGTDYLWQVDRKETDEKGICHDYTYIAFSAKNEYGSEYTKVLKIDLETNKIVFNTNINGVAEKSLQELSDLLFINGNDLVLVTSETKDKTKKVGASIIYADGSAKVIRDNKLSSIKIARDPYSKMYKFAEDESIVFITSVGEGDDKKYGAVKITKDKTVEVLFDNEWNSLKVKRDATHGTYIEYYGTNKFGKRSLAGNAQSFEAETSTFVSLASSHFGNGSRAKAADLSPEKRALRKKLMSKADEAKQAKKEALENGEDPNGSQPPEND